MSRTSSQHSHLALADALRAQARVVIHLGRREEAESSLVRALSLARAMPYPYTEAKALYVYGLLHIAMGEPAPACERLEAALAILNRLDERLYAEHVERAMRTMAHARSRAE